MNKFFNLFLFAGLLNFSFATCGIKANDESLAFEVHQQDYTFSTVFEMRSDKACLGSVVKSSFRVRTNYDLYDSYGKFESVGICRILTLGSLYAWGTEIDIYDANSHYIGMVDGQAMTGASAKFSLYNGEGTRVGIAYLELGGASFSIVDPNNEAHHLASLKRNFVQDAVDHWSVVVYDTKAIDLRIIKTFAAFAVDSQNSFKEDK